MIETPVVVASAAQATAFIRLTVPRSEIQLVMGPALAELHAALRAQDVAAVGPWFAHHLTLDPERFDLAASLPVAHPIEPVGRVRSGMLPAAPRVARTTYAGPYEGLGDAWESFMNWIEATGYDPAPELWERYVVGPEASDDSADWRTELNRPLR